MSTMNLRACAQISGLMFFMNHTLFKTPLADPVEPWTMGIFGKPRTADETGAVGLRCLPLELQWR